MDASWEDGNQGESLPATAEEIRRKRLEYFSINHGDNSLEGQLVKPTQAKEADPEYKEKLESKHKSDYAFNQNSGISFVPIVRSEGLEAYTKQSNAREISGVRSLSFEEQKRNLSANAIHGKEKLYDPPTVIIDARENSLESNEREAINFNSRLTHLSENCGKGDNEDFWLTSSVINLGAERRGSQELRKELFSPRMKEDIKAALGEKGLQDLLAKVKRDIERLNREQQSGRRQIVAESSQSEVSSWLDQGEKNAGNGSGSPSSRVNIITRDLQQLTEGEMDLFKKVRNYEQITIPKNTRNSFSADEIYRQAYGIQSEPVPPDKSVSGQLSGHNRTDYNTVANETLNTQRRKLSIDSSANMLPFTHPPNSFAFPPPPLYPGEHQGTPVSSHAPGAHYIWQDGGVHYYPQAAPQYSGQTFFPSSSQYLAHSSTPPSPSSFHYPSPHIVNPFGVPTFPNGVPLHLPPPPLRQPAHHLNTMQQQAFVPHPPPPSSRRNSLPITTEPKISYSADAPVRPLKVPHPPFMPPLLPQKDSLYPRPENRHISAGNNLHDVRYSEYKLQKYFESLQLEESQCSQQVPVLSLDEDDAASFATSATAKGVTGRLQNMGLELDYLSRFRAGPKQEASITDEEFETLSKGVRLCPECGASNKAYMNWCLSCGEILIGVEPQLPGNRKNKQPETVRSNRVSSSQHFSQFSEGQRENTFHTKSVDVENARENYPHKDSPESGRGGSVSNSPVRHNYYDHETKDSGRASIGDLHDSDESVDLREEKANLKNGHPDHQVDAFDQIEDPMIKELVIAYSKKESQPLKKSSKQLKASQVSNVDIPSISTKAKSRQEHEEALADDDYQEDSQPMNQSAVVDNVSVENGPVGKKSGRRKKKHRDRAIDVEIFGYEEIRDSRCNNQPPGGPVVPALNLDLSSEDEDFTGESSSERDEQEGDETPEEEVNSLYDYPAIAASEAPSPFKRVDPRTLTMTPKSQRRAASPLRSQARKVNSGHSINEPASYQRHWARSSIAWGSYHPRELATRSSLNLTNKLGSTKHAAGVNKSHSASSIIDAAGNPGSGQEVKLLPGRPSVANRQQRPASADIKHRSSAAEPVHRPTSAKIYSRMSSRLIQSSSISPERKVNMVTSAGLLADSVHPRDSSLQGLSDSDKFHCNVDVQPDAGDGTDTERGKDADESPRLLCAELHRLPQEEIEEIHPADKLHAIAKNAYNKLQEMTPRLAGGEVSMWQCLPDEIWIFVFAFLTQGDLKNLMLTCRYFYRLANDETLWRYITVKPRCALTDLALSTIAGHRPLSVAMVKCQGNEVTLTGLHNFFQQCQGRLRELNICGCSQGSFVGSMFLNVASMYCKQLTHLDASYCSITDESFIALSECAEKLESVCVNGFQSMSDDALLTLLKKHGRSLRTLELYACFSLTASVFRSIGVLCVNLRRLCLGSCNKLTDSAMITFSTHLARVEELDLRGCKNLRNDCIRKIVRNCPRIHTLVLANCQQISDIALSEVATYLKDTLRVLDVCGCNKVSDQGVISLAKNCDRLTSVDISSTRCTSTSVNQLASNNCSMYLETVKLSFLPGLSESCITNLIHHCKRLKLLHIFGCTSLRNLARLLELNPKLCIEGDNGSSRRTFT